MALTFREAKTQLGAGTITEIKSLLDQLGRPTTEPISTEDFDILRGLYPLLKQGMSLEDAIALIQQSEQPPQQPVPNVQQIIVTMRQEFLASSVEDSLRKDVKNFYLLYFQMWGDALKSPEVLQDDEVRTACKIAISSTLEAMEEINSNFLMSFRNRLRSKGFLPSVNQPQLQGAAVEVEIEEVA